MAERLMTITELKSLGGERFTLSFDDGSSIKTRLSVVADMSLYSGRELTESEYRKLLDASSLAECKARAMLIIGARAMSVKELTDRLIEKGETPANAEDCAQWLVGLGLLNDRDYAGMIARHYTSRGYGDRKIIEEFRRRGIDRSLWSEALDSLSEVVNKDDKLDALVASRFKGCLPDADEKRRVSASLARRGYSWDDIKSAVRRYEENTKDEQNVL